MATPAVRWEEGKTWAAAVNRAVRVPAVPPGLWTLPALLLMGALGAYFGKSWLAFVPCVLALGAILAWLYRVGQAGQRKPEYIAATALADAWAVSMPMTQAWDNLGRALDRLGWYEDTTETHKVPTGKTDEHGLPVLEDKTKTVRKHPEILITSEDPAGEVRLLVATVSGPVATSHVEGKASDLADFLGLNGWCVEVSPHAVPGYIEIRLARTSGRDFYGR